MIPSTGPVSFADLKTEFQDTYPSALNEFYAGKGLVPVAASGTNGLVPTAGAISLNQFHGVAASLATGARWKSIGTTLQDATIKASYSPGGVAIGFAGKKTLDWGETWFTVPSYTHAASGLYPVYCAGKWYDLASTTQRYSTTDGQTWTSTTGAYPYPYSWIGDATVFSQGVGKPVEFTLYGETKALCVNAYFSPYPTLSSWFFNVGYFGVEPWVQQGLASVFGTSCVIAGFIRNAPAGVEVGGDGLLVWLGLDTKHIFTSPNGTTWTRRVAVGDSGTGFEAEAINLLPISAYNTSLVNNILVIVLSNGDVLRTEDGVNWTCSPPVLTGVSGGQLMTAFVVSDKGYGMALGKVGTLWFNAVTTDGLTWTCSYCPELTNPTNLQVGPKFWYVSNANATFRAPI